MRRYFLFVLFLTVIVGFASILKAKNSGNKFEKINYNETIEKLQLLSEQGDPKAQNQLAWMYDQGIGVKENTKRASQLYLKSAKQGYKQAQINLGVMYELGRGVPQDFEEARRLYLGKVR